MPTVKTQNVDLLKQAVSILLEKPARPFAVGDVVTLKEGIGTIIRKPNIGDKLIITEVKDTPYIDENSGSASPYYKQPLNIKIAMVDDDGDLVEFWQDSRRYKHAE